MNAEITEGRQKKKSESDCENGRGAGLFLFVRTIHDLMANCRKRV